MAHMMALSRSRKGHTLASVKQVPKADTTAEAPTSVDQAEIDTLMRRFFDQGRVPATEAPAAAAVPAAHPRRDFDMASELLERAAQAFDLLIGRCQNLERELEESGERARTQFAEQDETIEQWKRLASGLKAQAEASEQDASALKARCDAAEARAAAADQRAASLERASAQAAGHAAMAEQLSTKLHDKVVSAFGIGSRAHPVLEAVATRAAATE
jgi:murein DD-endopeptidase MepM/ murein hydrolase activator NlpD